MDGFYSNKINEISLFLRSIGVVKWCWFGFDICLCI